MDRAQLSRDIAAQQYNTVKPASKDFNLTIVESVNKSHKHNDSPSFVTTEVTQTTITDSTPSKEKAAAEVSEAAQGLGATIGNAAESAKTQASGIIETIEHNVVEPIIEGVKYYAGVTAETASNASHVVADNAAHAYDASINTAVAAKDSTIQTTSNAAGYVSEKAVGTYNTVTQTASHAAEVLVDSAAQAYNAAVGTAANAYEYARERIIEAEEAIIAGTNRALYSAAAAKDSVVEKASEATESAKDTIVSNATAARETASDASYAAATKVGEVKSAAVQNATNAKDWTSEKSRLAANEAARITEDNANKVAAEAHDFRYRNGDTSFNGDQRTL